ncbi:type IV pilus biogenesis/stability protein PilW [Lysobacter antibioticus]|uniref:type IV pilus biogenesis/stability protein PilW n=1 Tax=Lysobacter antibioticus TaxID=84531 RepID=UPI000720AC55|nr:type IV pilus biogenesis/stability protein PilW [Lysobacter antibioticus]ALN63662.1 type IV pilus biogenesis/stability protein PilW [Lysobacter antibioticus]
MLLPEVPRSTASNRLPAAPRVRAVRTIVLLTVVVLAASACNRLSFIRPNMERKGFKQTAVEYDIGDKRGGRSGGEASALGRIQSAQSHLMAGDRDKARSEIKQALQFDSKSAEAYSLLAVMAEQDGNNAQAGAHYRKAAELAPDRGAALNNYGVWLCANNRASEGLTWFDKALADPRYGTPAVVLANSGACADTLGQGERADRDLRLAISLEPTNAMALGAMAKRQLRLGNAFEARAFSERRLAVEPITAEALMTASQIEQKLGDTAAAARYVQRMRAEFPDAQGSGTGDGGR